MTSETRGLAPMDRETVMSDEGRAARTAGKGCVPRCRREGGHTSSGATPRLALPARVSAHVHQPDPHVAEAPRPAPPAAPTSRAVLGVPLALTDYESTLD